MQCHELSEQLSHWRLGEEEQFALFVDDGDVLVRRLPEAVIITVALKVPNSGSAVLDEALRLAHPSLAHFPGALGLSSEDGRLWLMARISFAAPTGELLELLEALLNQRDSWQSMLDSERPASRVPLRAALNTSLIGKGIRHA